MIERKTWSFFLSRRNAFKLWRESNHKSRQGKELEEKVRALTEAEYCKVYIYASASAEEDSENAEPDAPQRGKKRKTSRQDPEAEESDDDDDEAQSVADDEAQSVASDVGSEAGGSGVGQQQKKKKPKHIPPKGVYATPAEIAAFRQACGFK